ncbi:MAG: AraC family transcriptional regulator [Polyangiaceae bacterium]
MRAGYALDSAGMVEPIAYLPRGAVSRAPVRTERAAPAVHLERVVIAYFAVHADTELGGVVRTLPEGCADLIVDVGPAQVRALLNGPRRAARVFEHAPGTRLFGVQLRPGAARLLVDTPARDLLDRSTPLEELFSKSAVGELVASLAAARELASAVPALERFVASELRGAPSVDERVARAVDRLVEQRGAVDVAALARHVGASPRNLARLFDVWIGLGPKELARMVRFQAILEALEQGDRPAWASLAASLGYADQSHLIRDFARFAGVTPTAL